MTETKCRRVECVHNHKEFCVSRKRVVDERGYCASFVASPDVELENKQWNKITIGFEQVVHTLEGV